VRRYIFLGGLIVAGATTMAVAFQGQPAAPLPELVRVKDNLYMIGSASPTEKGAFTGGNVGVFIADKGVVLVDSKLPGYGPRILERVKAVTPKPVIMIINTHTHGDHTGSNEGFPANVEIVAHENTKSNMEKMDAFKGDPATPTATRSSCSRRSASSTPAICSRGKMVRSSIARMAAAASSCRSRWPRPSRR
jgi:glyoxylase-like metal-dependent hydrolase (beta-lactamase superfamily II)